MEGETCAFTNDCGESSVCDASVCRQLCDLTNWMTEEVPTGGCPPGRTCQTYGWPNSDWSNIGICRPNGGGGGAGGN